MSMIAALILYLGLMTDYCVIGGHALMCSSLLMELKCKSMGKKRYILIVHGSVHFGFF